VQYLTSAQVIRFPAARTRVPERDRMQVAFDDLADALVAHRSAVTAWRFALGELDAKLNGLGRSMLQYRAQLETLNQGVGRLQREAQQLESWVDSLEEFA